MYLRDIVINYLNTVSLKMLDHDYNFIEDEIMKVNNKSLMLETKRVNKIRILNDKLKRLDNCYRDIKIIVKMLNKLDFVNDISEVEEYLSPYGTFCDRYTMYYRDDIFNYKDEEIVQIIMCEFFNCMQDYFSLSEVVTVLNWVMGTTLVMMYHLRIIDVPFGYSQDPRPELWHKAEQKGLKTFKPTSKTSNYLYKKAITDDPEKRLADSFIIETEDAITGEIKFRGLKVTACDGITMKSSTKKSVKLLKNDFGGLERATIKNDKIKDGMDIIETTKKLAKLKKLI